MIAILLTKLGPMPYMDIWRLKSSLPFPLACKMCSPLLFILLLNKNAPYEHASICARMIGTIIGGSWSLRWASCQRPYVCVPNIEFPFEWERINLEKLLMWLEIVVQCCCACWHVLITQHFLEVLMLWSFSPIFVNI